MTLQHAYQALFTGTIQDTIKDKKTKQLQKLERSRGTGRACFVDQVAPSLPLSLHDCTACQCITTLAALERERGREQERERRTHLVVVRGINGTEECSLQLSADAHIDR